MRSTPKALLALAVICAVMLISLDAFAAGKGGGGVSVKGYYRKDGTYVQPHTRSAPDGNPTNNYGFPGNYNPNKGEITPGDPNKYLERYEKRTRPVWPRTGTDD